MTAKLGSAAIAGILPPRSLTQAEADAADITPTLALPSQAEPTPGRALRPGERVVVGRLVVRADLNGQTVLLSRYDADRDRWACRVDHTYEHVWVRAANLLLDGAAQPSDESVTHAAHGPARTAADSGAPHSMSPVAACPGHATQSDPNGEWAAAAPTLQRAERAASGGCAAELSSVDRVAAGAADRSMAGALRIAPRRRSAVVVDLTDDAAAAQLCGTPSRTASDDCALGSQEATAQQGEWHARTCVDGDCEHFGPSLEDEEDAGHAFDRRAVEVGRQLDFANSDLDQPCSQDRQRRRSKYRGVQPTNSGKWKAQIGIDGNVEHLGTFEDEEDAAHAFDRRAIEVGRQPNFGPNGRVAHHPGGWPRVALADHDGQPCSVDQQRGDAATQPPPGARQPMLELQLNMQSGSGAELSKPVASWTYVRGCTRTRTHARPHASLCPEVWVHGCMGAWPWTVPGPRT